MTWALALLLGVLALMGMPLFAVLLGGVILAFHAAGTALTVIPVDILRLAETPVLISIPLFTFAGYLLSESQAPHRLVLLTDAFFGWVPGGQAVVALIACSFFTAVTGASGVTIV